MAVPPTLGSTGSPATKSSLPVAPEYSAFPMGKALPTPASPLPQINTDQTPKLEIPSELVAGIPPASDTPTHAGPRIVVSEPSQETARGSVNDNGRNGKTGMLLSPGAIIAIASIVIVVGMIVVVVGNRSSSSKSAKKEGSSEPAAGNADPGTPASPSRQPPKKVRPPGGDSSSPKSRPPEYPNGTPRMPGRSSMADLMARADADPTAGADSSVDGQLAAARQAMSIRDLQTAAAYLGSAARTENMTPAEQASVARTRKLFESLLTFWKAVDESAGTLHVGQELHVGQSVGTVVEVGGGQLTVHAAGRNYTYPLLGLPPALAIVLAEMKLRKGSPTANQCVGAFLAVDKRGDRKRARQYWQQAGAAGTELLDELPLAPPVEPATGSDAPQWAAVDATGEPISVLPDVGPRPQPPAPANRSAPPDRAAQAPAEAAIRKRFEAEYTQAGTVEGKKVLGKTLYQAAANTGDDPLSRYVLYRIVHDLAVEVGDPMVLCEVIDEMARYYQIDAMGMKAAGLNRSWDSSMALANRPAIAARAKLLLGDALRAKQYAAAEDLIRLALNAARAARDYPAIRDLEERQRVIRAERRAGS